MRFAGNWAAILSPGPTSNCSHIFLVSPGKHKGHSAKSLRALSLESLRASLPGVGWDDSRER
jgi:hypothetical protein